MHNEHLSNQHSHFYIILASSGIIFPNNLNCSVIYYFINSFGYFSIENGCNIYISKGECLDKKFKTIGITLS